MSSATPVPQRITTLEALKTWNATKYLPNEPRPIVGEWFYDWFFEQVLCGYRTDAEVYDAYDTFIYFTQRCELMTRAAAMLSVDMSLTYYANYSNKWAYAWGSFKERHDTAEAAESARMIAAVKCAAQSLAEAAKSKAPNAAPSVASSVASSVVAPSVVAPSVVPSETKKGGGAEDRKEMTSEQCFMQLLNCYYAVSRYAEGREQTRGYVGNAYKALAAFAAVHPEFKERMQVLSALATDYEISTLATR